MINDGEQVLHRGSVDKSMEEPLKRSKIANYKEPPAYARVFKGARNQVRDTKLWKLSETRPELAELSDKLRERAIGQDKNYSRNSPVSPRSAAPVSPRSIAHDGKSATSDTTTPSAASDSAPDTPSSSAAAATSASSMPSVPLSYIGAIPPASATDVGPGGNVSLTGLSASLASLIPGDDQTKVLAGWVYERLRQTSIEDLANLEIEFKFGLIADEIRPRHNFGTLSEAVVDPNYWRKEKLRFRSEVDVSHFKQLETLLDSLAMANAGSENNQINRVNTLTRDVNYQIKLPNSYSMSKIRVTYNDRDEVVECLDKERIGDVYVAQPNCVYDLKMSLSVERPINFEDIKDKIKATNPGFERNKNRLEWRSPGCQVDLTSVHALRAAGSGNTPGVSKEVEVECNKELLTETLVDIRKGKDTVTALDKYFEVMRYAVDSARFLARNVHN